MSAPLRRVLVRRPAVAGDWAGAGWREPDPAALAAQHEAFCALLDDLGAEVEVAAPVDGLVDAVYMHDPVMLTGAGAIPLRMRKPIRSEEPDLMASELERLGVPVIGRLPEGAWADGGDRFWLDDTTMAIGLGYRTTPAGLAALAELVAPEGIDVVGYDLPHDAGPDHVLHLQSLISAVTDSLLVVYEPLMPVRLLDDLRARGYDWLPITPDEYLAMGCNILCVRPGVVVMVDGLPDLRGRLEARGVEIHAYDGSELSLKGDGGPTCLTCPILRAS
ncbi:MAG: dimethylargininase [Solirubrobacteraceae bacterium]|jgi:N-dimethylarginine dimethylaminohydrolase|nr:dimethylargininase [Solirubrobacteraceae bacterium]